MYVYAFLEAPTEDIVLPMGIEETSSLVVCDELAALTEPGLSLETLQQSDERLLRAVMDHDRVIQELFQETTVLPLRFGTSFLSQEHLISHLQEKQSRYSQRLKQLNGKAEYLIKMLPIPFDEATNGDATSDTGRDYFMAKKRRYQAQANYNIRQKDEFSGFLDVLREHFLDVVQGAGDEDAERVYVLIERPQAFRFGQFLRDHVANYSTWQIHVGEALPPYHFVA